MKNHNIINNPIIFIGAPRSGTTIISEIVMRHQDIGFISNYSEKFTKFPVLNILRILLENKLWDISGQKKQLNKTNIFNKLLFKPSEAYKYWTEMLCNNYDYKFNFLLNTKVPDKLKTKINKELSSILYYQRRKRLAFKNTGPSKLEFFLSIFPNAQFVYIKRNPIHVIESLLAVDFWKEIEDKKIWWQGPYNNKEIEILKHCNSIAYLTGFQLKKLYETHQIEIEKTNVKIIEINYDDFVNRPKIELERLLKNLNLINNSEKCFDYLSSIKIVDRNSKKIELIPKKELELLNTLFF
jgi:hypothetical protein